MSTTIYHAWRCEIPYMSRALQHLRGVIWRRVLKLVDSGLRVESWESISEFIKLYGEAGLHVFVEQSPGQAQRAYLIAYGLPPFVENIRTPSWLPEYAYWNSTDRPKRMTEREWDLRKKTWNRVALEEPKWDTHRLLFPILHDSPGCRVALLNHFQKRKRRKG